MQSLNAYMIGDEFVNFRDKVLVAIDSRKWTSLNASVIGQVIDKVSGTFLYDALHSQLPSSEVNVFDLEKRKRFKPHIVTIISCQTYHVIRNFQLCCVRVIDENVKPCFRYVSIQTIAWNVSIIADVLKMKTKK